MENIRPQREIPCKHCESTFNSDQKLKLHMLWHKRVQDQKEQSEKLIAENGGAGYNGDLDLVKMTEFHKNISELPTSWQKLVNRVRVNGKFIYKCKECEDNEGYEVFNSFLEHVLKHTGERTYKCRMPGCSLAFRIWGTLKGHLLTHCNITRTDPPKIACEICGDRLRNGTALEKHLANHTYIQEQQEAIEKRVLEESEAEEDDDDEDFFDKENPSLEELVNFHANFKIKPETLNRFTEIITIGEACHYKCTACDNTCTELAEHETHVIMHTGEKPWKCRVLGCSCRFHDFPTLEGHLLGHSDDKQFVCHICGQFFKDKETLTKHFPNHSKKKQFSCELCSAEFSSLKEKNSHLDQHDPAKDVLKKCDLCDSAFLNRALLNNHLRKVHSINLTKLPDISQRRLACDVCGKTYKSKGGLRDHYKNHTNERNHKCKYCSSTFKDNCDKVRHENLHDPGNEVLVECELCESTFLSMHFMNFHLRRDHGVAVLNVKGSGERVRRARKRKADE